MTDASVERRDRGADHRAPGGRRGPALLRVRDRPAPRVGHLRRGEAYVAYTTLIEPGRLWAGVAAIAGTVLLVGLLTVDAGRPLRPHAGQGAGRAAGAVRRGRPADRRCRARCCGPSSSAWRRCPTLGFGAAALAWTAMVDPTGWRRGWHDLRAGSVVVDVRPVPGGRGARGGGAAPGRQPHRDAAGPRLADAAAPGPDPRQAAARAAARAGPRRRRRRRSRRGRGSAGRWSASARRRPGEPLRAAPSDPTPTAPPAAAPAGPPARRRRPAGRSPSTPASSSRCAG